MSTKLFLGVMVIALAIAGYVVYSQIEDEEKIPMTDNGISFICEDNSYFSAEFNPDFSSVDIVVDGVISRSATRLSGSESFIYETGEYRYTFAGEGVTVVSSATNTSINCSQPFDPNNAPYNFGDMGEGGGDEQNLIMSATENIVGKWESVDDKNFTRTFMKDGTLTDSYVGSDDTVGNWVIFNNKSEVETPFPLEQDYAYLKITTDIGATEVMYYKISKVTPEELELIYMDRGGVLKFIRLNSNAEVRTEVKIDRE